VRSGAQAGGGPVHRWLLAALCLHGVLGLLAASLTPAGASRAAGPAQRLPAQVAPASATQLLLLDEEWLSAAARARAPAAGDAAAASELAASDVLHQVRHDALGPGQPHARLEGSTPAVAPALASSGPARSSLEQAPAAEAGSSGAAEASPALPGVPQLSLDQLGIGANNPFHGLAPAPPSTLERAQARLQASLRQGSLDGERGSGLGPEGPVVSAAHRLVVSSEALLETSAVLQVQVDTAGRVTSVELLHAASQTGEWSRLSERLRKALAPLTLRLADAHGAGSRLKLRLATSLRLPSGAAPGLRTSLLGQTLTEAGGPGSASLSLSPGAPPPTVQPTDTTGQHRDFPMQLEVGVLKWQGDVADAVAAARRVVEVSLLSIEAIQAP
jgi:hypothetical protein